MSEDHADYRGRMRSKSWTVNDEPSQTIQSDAVAADIQTILKAHGVTGFYEHLAGVDAQFLDVTEMTDYADVMREAARAEETFMGLPAEVRSLFGNNVARWLDAAHDKEKRDALAEEAGAEVPTVEGKAEVPSVTVEPVSEGGDAK